MSDSPQDAKGIFLAAVDIADAAERAAFVERSCGDDPALRQRVEDLLRAYGQSGGPLDKLAAALASTEIAEPIREQVGATIGPYKLMEQIGEGGFGLVFVAEQERPIRRKVALKIIKPGMDTRDVIARFEAERQALALMDHPNIARVLDAGTTQSGRPYFVMELVRGIPITDYCDKNQLTPRERLELFIPVCNAIQHAHLKGIIHRDIKPSNVLVTMHDGRPVVKVIDFGVAKALHQSLTDRTVYTRFAQMIGTPLYMSPEQAEMSGLDIDTRTDVYSLGVVLYELLTGTTPLDKKRLAKAAYDELLKIIREDDPPKPSVRLSQSTDSLPSIAALRKTEPAKLSKMFHGDVDWIAMKALEKDRTRRYETANAFAADVLRYLNDEPVEACPPSTGYRLRKFARKHRKTVILLAAIAAALLIGVAGTTWGLFRANIAEENERAERHVAEMERNRAREAEVNERQQREATEAQRDRAERQLANGLLRPIGFANPAEGSSIPATDPAEMHSFVDWSAIKESPLKLRVLEIAFENPETALRIARRAERVIQSCVGLSPTRRAQAVKLVSTRQRDMTADPRIRIAACWLALELGSADLPAWAESCNYLSDPKNKSVDRFSEFVAFAAIRSDPQQVAQLSLEPLLAILEKSKDHNVIGAAAQGLAALAPRLGLAQVRRAGDALLAILQKSNDDDAIGAAANGLAALAPRLGPAEVARSGDALLAILEKSHDPQFPSQGLVALAPRLEPAQVRRSGDALLAILQKSNDEADLATASEGFVALAPRLRPAQVARSGDALLAILQKSNDENVLATASEGFVALAPRLEAAQVARAWDALLVVLEKSKDPSPGWASPVLVAVAPRLETAQVRRAGDALLAILEKSKDPDIPYWASQALVALAPRLEPAQVTRASDALLAIPEKLKDPYFPYWASQVLIALAPRLEPARVRRAGDALLAVLGKSENDDARVGASHVSVALAPRLEPAQATRARDALLAILGKSEDSNLRTAASEGLVPLAPRLEPAQAKRAWDALLTNLEKTDDPPASRASRSQGLVALAPRLEAAQVTRARDALLAMLEKSNDDNVRDAASQGLFALAPRLEPASRDKLATKATTSLLDDRAVIGYFYYDTDGKRPDPRPIRIARSIASPRSLAKLLSHPACVGEQRESLLKRFEELVFYDGKPVFLQPEGADGEQPTHEQTPPRRFHNLHDAAAWIQQNWPDFDLEASCPVTWPGETHDTRPTGSR
jgi:serine/threonine protein kinase